MRNPAMILLAIYYAGILLSIPVVIVMAVLGVPL